MLSEKTSLSISELAEQIVGTGMGQWTEIEDALVHAAIKQTGGNIKRASALLGLSRSQLDYRYLKICRPFDRGTDPD